MRNRFKEWDKFYARYETSEDANEAFEKYRESRRRNGTLPKTLSPLQRLQMAYEMRVRRRQMEDFQELANDHARESLARASKNTI